MFLSVPIAVRGEGILATEPKAKETARGKEVGVREDGLKSVFGLSVGVRERRVYGNAVWHASFVVEVEVVGERDAVARLDWQDFMLYVREECGIPNAWGGVAVSLNRGG